MLCLKINTEGKTVCEIADALTDENVPTPKGKDKWSASFHSQGLKCSNALSQNKHRLADSFALTLARNKDNPKFKANDPNRVQRVCAYCRVSTLEESQDTSYELALPHGTPQ